MGRSQGNGRGSSPEAGKPSLSEETDAFEDQMEAAVIRAKRKPKSIVHSQDEKALQSHKALQTMNLAILDFQCPENALKIFVKNPQNLQGVFATSTSCYLHELEAL